MGHQPTVPELARHGTPGAAVGGTRTRPVSQEAGPHEAEKVG